MIHPPSQALKGTALPQERGGDEMSRGSICAPVRNSRKYSFKSRCYIFHAAEVESFPGRRQPVREMRVRSCCDGAFDLADRHAGQCFRLCARPPSGSGDVVTQTPAIRRCNRPGAVAGLPNCEMKRLSESFRRLPACVFAEKPTKKAETTKAKSKKK